MKRAGLVNVTGELLAELLGFPKGHVATHVWQDHTMTEHPIKLRIEGPDMPQVLEGCAIPWVQVPAR